MEAGFGRGGRGRLQVTRGVGGVGRVGVRGRGHLEKEIREEKRSFSLIYAIAIPHHFIVAPCQLKKDSFSQHAG